MDVVTPSQMRQIDQRAIEEFRIPGIVLMENAALQTVKVILEHYPLDNLKYPYDSGEWEATSLSGDSSENLVISKYVCPTMRVSRKTQCVLVLAGCGNNGGDGFAIARHLYLIGYQVSVLIVSEGGRKPRGDAETNLNALYALQNNQISTQQGSRKKNFQQKNAAASLEIHWLEDEKDLSQVSAMLQEANLIVDALFGTGLDRPVTGLFATIIDMVNAGGIPNAFPETKQENRPYVSPYVSPETKQENRPRVSVDIPSGINGETGQIMGAAIQATHTVAYGYLKPGHLLFPGREYSGQVHVVPISLPKGSAKSVEANMFTLNDREVAQMLKPRPRNSHKGTFGKVAVIAGSTGLTGAAHLASLAALRAGAGLVTLGIPAALNSIMEQKLTEVMTFPLEDRGLGHLVTESLRDVNELLKDKDVLAFGPGCGKNPGVFEILRNILGRFHIPIVIDADGLNHISKDMSLLRSHQAAVILTPHPGEMSRLTGLDMEEILSRPVEIAAKVAINYGCIVLLKGAASVVAEPKGRVYINASGNAGMAKGGSGDVLTGIIASLIAQGYPSFEATVLGCYIHGRSGDQTAKRLGETGMIAGDLIDDLPNTFLSLTRAGKQMPDIT